MQSKSQIIIVDDEPIILAGLKNWLSRDYKVVCFESAEKLLEAFDQFELENGLPTCILLDFQLPGINGVELQRTLKLMNAESPIIFMSGNAQQTDIIDAWRGGAVDFVLKPFTPIQIAEALDRQFETLKNRAPLATPSKNIPDVTIPITKREAEVLLLLGKGHQQIEVANILGISIRTVKMYRSFLRDKLGLYTLAELARFCIENEKSIKKCVNK